jgi:hypothetical protein
MDYMLWASRLNQLSLLPFLAFLWTLWHIHDAPKRMVYGWTLYLLFITIAIPAGLWCKAHYGTSMANVDWVHGTIEGKHDSWSAAGRQAGISKVPCSPKMPMHVLTNS